MELEAQRLIQEQKYDEALPLLKKALTTGEYISREIILQNIALCYIKMDGFREALPYLEQVININEQNTSAQYNLAYSYYQLEDFKKSCKIFKNLEQYEGITPDIAYHLSLCLVLDGQLKEAEGYFSYIIENYPNPDLIYNLGLELIHRGHSQASRNMFIAYLNNYQNDIDATFGLGIAYIECKEHFKAIECLERVIKWDPDKYVSAYTMLGVAYFQTGKIKEAYTHIRTAISKDERSYESWYYLGIIYEQGKQITEAIKAFNKASELNPDSYEVWEHLGFIYFNQQEYNQARAAFKKAYLLSKSSKYAYQIALIYMIQENYKTAVDYFTLSMEEDTLQDSLENISICYYHLKEYSKVIDILGNLDEEKLNKAILHFILGSSYMKLGNNTESRKRLTLGHKRFPSEVNILYNLGLLEANSENFQEASRFFENALIINRSPEILYALALSKMQMKDTQEAVTYLDEYQLYIEKDEDTLYKLGLMFLQLKAVPHAISAFQKVLSLNPEHNKAHKYLRELESSHD